MYIHIDWMFVYIENCHYSAKLSHVTNCQFTAILWGE